MIASRNVPIAGTARVTNVGHGPLGLFAPGRLSVFIPHATAHMEADAESNYTPNRDAKKGPLSQQQEVPVLLRNGKKALVHKKRRTVAVVNMETDKAKSAETLGSNAMLTIPALMGAAALSWAASKAVGKSPPGSSESVELKDRAVAMLNEATAEMGSAEKIISEFTPVAAIASKASYTVPAALTVVTSRAAAQPAALAQTVGSVPGSTASSATVTVATAVKDTVTAPVKAVPSTPVAVPEQTRTTMSSSRAQSILSRVDDILSVLDKAAVSDSALPPFASQVSSGTAGVTLLKQSSATPAQSGSGSGGTMNSFNSSSGGSSLPSGDLGGTPAPAPALTPAPVVPKKDDKPTKLYASRLKEQKNAPVWQEPQEEAPIVKVPGPADGLSLEALKGGLLDIVYGTTRGVTASVEQRAAIEEYITTLESSNPNTVATDAVEVLEGRWKLVYTSNHQTLMLLNAINSLPLVDIGDVYQVIDGQTLTAHNKIDIAVPVMFSLSAEAGFEVRTPRQFKVRFHKVGVDTYVETPQLWAAIDFPDSITVMGNVMDLTTLKSLVVQPVNYLMENAQAMVQQAVSPQFGLEPSEMTSLWMLTTYLDDTMRISRDDNGRVFVMLRDVSIDGLVSR